MGQPCASLRTRACPAHAPRIPRACPRAPLASRALQPHARVPSSPNVHCLAPEHSSKRSTESPDSRTLPRLFPRISRQGITFST
ncbi:hypothetical protein CDL15_Pgr002286 [Punica granatum]|uniref:Uncharacterized protein n=1 Tax=Punica granatum TaxID=22663 RepID=A0A218W0Q6_PUNGR|nr:hypothetical protein CDL15_Pgr002286 [Punica granatum]